MLLMVGWTLSYELLFYFVFALTARMPGRPIAVALAMLWGLSFIVSKNFYAQFIFNDFWAEFLVGTILFRLVDKKAALFAVGGVALVAFLIFDYYGLPDRRSIYFGLPAVTIVSVVLGLEGSFEKWCPTFIVLAQKFLGDASYSIYLSHFFSLNLAYLVIYKILKLSGGSAGVAYMILAVFASVLAGGLVHVLIEKKILRALRNMGERNAKSYVINPADTGAS
ncbi:acyltransferase family protein [Paraburkholderia sp.]|uniref:acyltransferase family protein n=1 Tax=Paraburkholderia sp. TaxID=1926495 RepID=UPI0039E589D0